MDWGFTATELYAAARAVFAHTGEGSRPIRASYLLSGKVYGSCDASLMDGRQTMKMSDIICHKCGSTVATMAADGRYVKRSNDSASLPALWECSPTCVSSNTRSVDNAPPGMIEGRG